MAQTLKTQLEALGKKLPTVDTAHYVLLQNSKQGPVAFLFEKCEPPGERPVLRVDSIVRPTYRSRVYATRRNQLKHRTYRTRYKFDYQRVRKNTQLPVNVQSPKSRWIEIVDTLYTQLRNHDAEAWELVLGDLLDIRPTSRSAGPCSAGRG